jgi:hypothetical protein
LLVPVSDRGKIVLFQEIMDSDYRRVAGGAGVDASAWAASLAYGATAASPMPRACAMPL